MHVHCLHLLLYDYYNNYHHYQYNTRYKSCYIMWYRRRVAVAVQRYPLLAFRLKMLGGQRHKTSAIYWEMNKCALSRKVGEHHGSTIRYRGEKNFFHLMVFIPQTVSTAQTFGRIKENSESVDGSKRPGLGHYTRSSVSRMYEERNALTGHFRNYESNSENPTYKTKTHTTRSTTSVDACLTVVSFSPTVYNTKYPRKGKRGLLS